MRKKAMAILATMIVALGLPFETAFACDDCSGIPFEHCVLGTPFGYQICTQPVDECELEGPGCGPFASAFTLDGSVRYALATDVVEDEGAPNLKADGSYLRRNCDQAIVSRNFTSSEAASVVAQTTDITL